MPAPPAEEEAAPERLGVADAVKSKDAEGTMERVGCPGVREGGAEGDDGAEGGGVGVATSESAPVAVDTMDPPAVFVEWRVPAGDEDGAAEEAPVLLVAVVGVPGMLPLATSLGGAARVAEAVRYAEALPDGRVLAVPGAVEGLGRAVDVVAPLGAEALLAEGGALARTDAETGALLEGVRDVEGQVVPLMLPLGDPEDLALRDGDCDAREEKESRGVPVCCAAVPLCVRDAAALSVANKVTKATQCPSGLQRCLRRGWKMRCLSPWRMRSRCRCPSGCPRPTRSRCPLKTQCRWRSPSPC